MEETDKKLFEKFQNIISEKPDEDRAAEFLSDLSQEEYGRLIYLFENNEIEGMDNSMKTKLIEVYKKIKEGLSKAG